jgi:hypothetical protein
MMPQRRFPSDPAVAETPHHHQSAHRDPLPSYINTKLPLNPKHQLAAPQDPNPTHCSLGENFGILR